MKHVGKWLWIMTVFAIWVEVKSCSFPLNLRSEWLASWKKGKTSNCCDDWEGVACGLNSRVVSLSLEGPDYISESVEVHFNASVLHPFEELRELNLTYMGIKSWDEDKGNALDFNTIYIIITCMYFGFVDDLFLD